MFTVVIFKEDGLIKHVKLMGKYIEYMHRKQEMVIDSSYDERYLAYERMEEIIEQGELWRTNSPGQFEMILCRETFKVYATVPRAAKLHGVTSANFRRHLYGFEGYETINGLTFRRI